MTYNTKQRLQPLVAMRALKTLINDPERTEQVFIIIRAMSGNSLQKAYERFRKTPFGQQVMSDRRVLISALQDRDSLRQLPADSLGRRYLGFVEREEISADGLVEASETGTIDDSGLRHYSERMRDMHDLWHVTTGYGRDTFGEACLLAFTYAQTKNRGVGIIALVAMVKISRELGSGVRGAMWQAYKAGRKAAWLPEQDWEHLLSQPLQQVREQLNVGAPEKYQAVSTQFAAVGA
jgi:ubiquinone biosynthesis protein COQ4